jgi:hypothetical protein
MTENGTILQPERDVGPWRAVGLFLALTICLSGIFWAFVIGTQTVTALYIFGLMWMPALSAILTCRILRRPLTTLGWTWNGRYALIGYLVPIAISFVQAWLRLKTGSIWPAVFLHASHNLWMQSVFQPLTSDREYTKWVAGDLGLAFVVVAFVVAFVFWRKRRELPDVRHNAEVAISASR